MCVTWSREQFNGKKNVTDRNDNNTHTLEKEEVTDCQREYMEEAENSIHTVYWEVAVKDNGFQ